MLDHKLFSSGLLIINLKSMLVRSRMLPSSRRWNVASLQTVLSRTEFNTFLFRVFFQDTQIQGNLTCYREGKGEISTATSDVLAMFRHREKFAKAGGRFFLNTC